MAAFSSFLLLLKPTTTFHFPKNRFLQLSISLLFFLNFLYLLTYFHHHNSLSSTSPPPPPLHLTPPPPHPHRLHHHILTLSSTPSKPWPILPSYLPWTPPSSTSSSCESYFGNGFSKTSIILPRTKSVTATSSSSSSWFRCRYNSALMSSVCDGGRVLMDPNKIRMSVGGEMIKDVIGRLDEDELPVFELGAFRLFSRNGNGIKKAVSKAVLDDIVPIGQVGRHTMRELFENLVVVGDELDFHCNQWIEEPTLLVTRFEYANVFHTYTDWYSSYVSSRSTGLPTRPNVIFLDGHARTQLEETWEALFSDVKFAKNFTGPVCFRHAIFVPLGYETAWFKGLSEPINCQGASSQDLWSNPDDSKTARLSEFGEMIKSSFDLPVERPRSLKPSSEYNVLFVRREDYLAHPRHGGKVESRLSNEQEVFDSLKSWVSNLTDCRINLVNGLFAHMSMREQIRAIEDANVIIGAHGAGLTHVVSASPKTVILEIISSQFQRPHFELISKWKGLDYHAINLPASSADPKEVIERLKSIMKSIGC